MKFLTKIFGTRNDKILKQIQPIVNRINELEAKYKAMDDDTLVAQTGVFKERLEKGESTDSILPEAFAVCRETSRRVLGQRHYDVQLIGGIVLTQGKIAEMKTGEGKTLTATLPSYLHGLTGKGAHVVTVNDYLAKRDAEWMSKVYNKLGLSTGIILHGLDDDERKAAYGSDITYGTNNEFGFDYLRDNMKTDPSRLVQRGCNFAIVDEVDSILIDEARTPLIISGPTDTNIDFYKKVNAVTPGIQKDVDYTVDEKVDPFLLPKMVLAKWKRLRIKNLYEPENVEWLHHIQQALKAHIIFKKDVDYVVRNGQVLIVDEFTGRLMPGRRYSDGLTEHSKLKNMLKFSKNPKLLQQSPFKTYLECTIPYQV